MQDVGGNLVECNRQRFQPISACDTKRVVEEVTRGERWMFGQSACTSLHRTGLALRTLRHQLSVALPDVSNQAITDLLPPLRPARNPSLPSFGGHLKNLD